MVSCCSCIGSEKTAPDKVDPKEFFFRKRGCTDVCCILFFAIYWGGLAYITALAITTGDPRAVFYGKDYLGNRCGSGSMSGKEKVYFPRIDQDIQDQIAIATSMPWRMALYGLCVEDCPNVTKPQDCFSHPESCKVYDYGTQAEYSAAGGSASYYATIPSLNLMNRCIPNDASSLDQAPDRCAFPQCDGASFSPCDTEYPTTWVMSYPKSLQCDVIFRVGTIQQLRPATSNSLTQAIGHYIGVASRIVDSIAESWNEVLLFGILMPILLGLTWLVLLRFFAGTFTYIIIILLGLGMCFLSLYAYLRAGALDTLLNSLNGNATAIGSASYGTNVSSEMLNDPTAQALGLVNSAQSAIATVPLTSLSSDVNTSSNENPTIWWIVAIVMTVVTLLYIVTMCAARKRIKVSIALVREGTKVLAARPMTMLFPINTLVAQIWLVLYFVTLILFLATANITSETITSGMTAALRAGATYLESITQYNATVNDMADIDSSANATNVLIILYLTFGFLWTLESITNIGWTAMSGSVAHWYFLRDEPSGATSWIVGPLARSLGRVFRYHLGSIFFGSFVIAVVQLIRVVLMVIDKYTKNQQKKNLLLWFAIKCCQCCMWCLEKTIKYITNYAYIYVAMQGSSFCGACFATFGLIINNAAQLAINSFVRTILSWIQLLGLPFASAWLCNVYLVTNKGRSDTMYASILVAFMAYTIARNFAVVFSCVLDTLFVCCCRDKADFQGQFMPDGLRESFGFKKKGKKDKKADAADDADETPAEAEAAEPYVEPYEEEK